MMPRADLDDIVEQLAPDWGLLRGADILVTGGTGFFGVWLISALLHASRSCGLGLRIHVMARRPAEFVRRAPEFGDTPGLSFHSGDIRNFTLPEGTEVSHIIHTATAASAALNDSDPAEMAHVAAEGTRNVLELARQRNVARVLFTSSGAVYGRNPPEITHVREDQMGVTDPLAVRNAYAEGKRMAELYCAAFWERHHVPVTIARCFAFVGPYLPLDAHYAIGNFIRDALRGAPIIVQSDGTSRRSYLYASDLVVWLLKVLLRGEPARAYNVGSDVDLSVGDLARLVGKLRNTPVEVRGVRDPTRPIDSYVPAIDRIRTELGGVQQVDLLESIRRTMNWYERVAAHQQARR